MNNLQKIVKNLKGNITKNSPTIFTGLGVAGLITTTVMAVKATPKALQLIEDEEEKRKTFNEPEMEPMDIVKLTWKCYIPSAIMGGLTIGCIIGANSINLRRNATLASIYSISETTLREYQNKVVDTIGKNKEQKIRDDIAKDKVKNNPVVEKDVILTGKGNTLCFESISGRYFRSDIEKIRQSFNELSRQMLNDGYISLNDVYYELDLTGTKMGDHVGWHVDDGLIEPRFSSQLTENNDPCLVLEYNIDPRYGVEM